MSEKYDIMTYNGTFAEVAKHDSEGNVRFQRVFYGMSRRAMDGALKVEEIGNEPMPMSGMYWQSLEGVTAADAYHRSGKTVDEINEIDGDAMKSNFMQNPFGLQTPEDVKEYVGYSDSLQGKYEGLRDPQKHHEDMRTRTRREFQDEVLDIIDGSNYSRRNPQAVIDLLESELMFSEILATDYGLREEVEEMITDLKAKLDSANSVGSNPSSVSK
jgi:hypothetical protein